MKNLFEKISIVLTAIATGNGAAALDKRVATSEAISMGTRFSNLKQVIAPLFKSELPRFYAGHRSHSSHASHASHYSHRSSVGSAYPYLPPQPPNAQPAYVPLSTTNNLQANPPTNPPPPTPKFQALETELPILQNDYEKRAEVIKRVQLKLITLGVYAGPIDGVIGAPTRDAIDIYKIKRNAPRGSYLDASTLSLLGITVD